MRPTRCQPVLPHDVVLLNTHEGSGTTRTQELFELFTGRSTQSVFQEPGRFRRAWGDPGDGSAYVTVQAGGCVPAVPTCSGAWWVSSVNTTVRRSHANETALIKSHHIDWGCHLAQHHTPPLALAPPRPSPVPERGSGCYVARVVHMLRNPLDNIYALFKMNVVKTSSAWQKVVASENRGHALDQHKLRVWRTSAVASAARYVWWHARSLRAYRARRVLFVHYEDLSERPDTVFERTLRFVGVAPSTANFVAAQERARRTARPRPHPDFVLGLPWDLVRVPQLFDEETVTLLVGAFDAALANYTLIQDLHRYT